MGEVHTTMEGRLAAITASLNESRALLASCAQRLGVKDQEGHVTTTPSFATTTTPLLVPGRVREQLEAKASSPCLTTTPLVMTAGDLQADAVLAQVTPTRSLSLCSNVSVSNKKDVVVLPTSGMAQIPAPTLTGAGNRMLQGVGVSSTNTPASCLTHVWASPHEGLVDGTRAVNTDQLHNNSFPRFDGTNPGLWREKCLKFFTKFNICKPFWTTAAKAKEWFEAYKLRQVVGTWPEFIDDVEVHFGVKDVPLSATMLGSTHPSGVVHASRDISTETSNSCLRVSPKEVLVTAAEPAKPSLIQLAKSTQPQFTQLKLALAIEYQERKKAPLGKVTQMTEPVVDSSDLVLTHVNGVSLFVELWAEHADMVCSKTTLIELADEVFTCVGGLSLFLELDLDSANNVFEVQVLTCVGDCSIFLEPGMSEPTEVFTTPSNVDLDKILDHGVRVPYKGCKLQLLLSREMQQHGTNSDTPLLPWDLGTHEDVIHELIFLLPYYPNELWNATLPDASREADRGLTSSQRFGIEMRKSMPNMLNQKSVDYYCSVQFGFCLTLGARCLVYALLRCTNQHTSQNYTQIGQGLLVILFFVLKGTYNCKNLCLLKRLAEKFQCRPWNPCVHQLLIREIVQPVVPQHGELMIIACLSLAHAVCTYALYWNCIGDSHGTTP